MKDILRTCADCGQRYALWVGHTGEETPAMVAAVEAAVPPQGEWICASCEEKREPEPELDDYEYALRNAVC